MSFTKLAKQPGQRAEDMLAGSPDDPASAYNQLADGLYPGETALKIGGHLIAVDIIAKRIETGEGVNLKACARWIDADGKTRVDGHDQHVEASLSYSAHALEIDRIGLDAIKKEMLLAVLGEPPTMVPIPKPEGEVKEIKVAVDEADYRRNPAKAPPGTILAPEATETPLIGWTPDVRLNASIRHAIDLASAGPVGDVAKLLDL